MNWEPIDIAWMAGLFEGEGWIVVRKGRRGAGVALRMVDRDVIERLFSISGIGTLRKEAPTVTGKDQFCWSVNYGEDVRCFLEAILPFLSARRTVQAHAALENLKGMRDIGRQGKETCIRGHSDWVQRRNGDRWRRTCLTCRRDNEAARRARIGSAAYNEYQQSYRKKREALEAPVEVGV